MRVALVHDYLVDGGGAERTLLELHRLFPEAPIYTAVYDPRTTLPEFADCEIHVSILQRLAHSKKRYKQLLPLYPLVFLRTRLTNCDLVISSASAFAKAVEVDDSARHICYCHTPPRFVWHWDKYHEQEHVSRGVRVAVQAFQPYFRKLDLLAARRVHHFIANSSNVRGRIRLAYGRDASIVYPPVELDRFRIGSGPGHHFLIVSRLNRYKRIDMAIEAFNQLRLPLLVAGGGPDLDRLRQLAGPTIKLLGRVDDEELRELYATCKALVLPGEEDLGLTPVEASASGRPTIALGKGGARETVVHGQTGVLYAEPTVEHLVAAVRQLDTLRFDPAELRGHAEQFGVPRFRKGILNAVRQEIGAVPSARRPGVRLSCGWEGNRAS